MEYLSGGPVLFSADDEVPGPILTLTQTRRIMRDVINGLEFRTFLFGLFFYNIQTD